MEKAPLLVAIGGLSDGQKVVLAVEPGDCESTSIWSRVLRDFKNRGRIAPAWWWEMVTRVSGCLQQCIPVIWRATVLEP